MMENKTFLRRVLRQENVIHANSAALCVTGYSATCDVISVCLSRFKLLVLIPKGHIGYAFCKPVNAVVVFLG
jgi:hypothetical protein